MQVHLYIRVRLANGKRVYADPAYAANGRIKPFYAVIQKTLSPIPKVSTTTLLEERYAHLEVRRNGCLCSDHGATENPKSTRS